MCFPPSALCFAARQAAAPRGEGDQGAAAPPANVPKLLCSQGAHRLAH